MNVVKYVPDVLKHVPNGVSTRFARQVLIIQKNSPTLLFGAGVVGVIATVVLSSRATLKIEDILDEAQRKLELAKRGHAANLKEYSEQDYRKDVAFAYVEGTTAIAKLYGPAFIVGVVSIGSLVGSHHILTKRNAGLMAAYASLMKGFDEYRARVLGEVGPDKERELRYGSETREVLEETKRGEPKVKKVTRVSSDIPSIYAKFFDEGSSSFRRDPEWNNIFLHAQQQFANDKLHARGHLFLNEVYDALGIEHTKAGAVVGWVMSKDDSDNYVDFGLYDIENQHARDFVNGREGAILLDFNVDGVILDKI